MDQKLISKLNQKSTLDSLKNKYQIKMVIPCSNSSVFSLLHSHDSSIGYIANKKIYLNSNAWNKIKDLVEREVGFNLLNDSIKDLSKKDRVENTITVRNEKIASTPPQSGFAMVRLLGKDNAITSKSSDFLSKASRKASYLGVHIDEIEKWDISNIIVVENFAAFMAMDNDYLSHFISNDDSNLNLIIYRGDKHQNIYAIAANIARLGKARYIYADYDLSGLSLAKIISDRISSDGYILPLDPEFNDWFVHATKKDERLKQAHIVITDANLLRYYHDIKERFLAVPQESLIAHQIPMTIVPAL